MHTGDDDYRAVGRDRARPPAGVPGKVAAMTVGARRPAAWPAGPPPAVDGVLPLERRRSPWWPPPAAIRAWSLPAGVHGLIALVIFTAFWVGRFVPSLVAHPGAAQLDQTSMDPNFFVWSLRWWPYALGHGLDPMRTTMIGAPAGFNLAWLTTVPALAVLAAPVTAAFGPVVAFNLLTALAPPVAGWAAFVLCRRLTGRFWPALAGGTVYGFSACEMNHTVPGHLNITVSMLVPLTGYLVVLWRDGSIGRAAFISLLAAVLVLQMLVFLETFAGLTVLWAAALPLAYCLARPAQRGRVARLTRHVGVAYLAAAAVGGPYLGYVLGHAPGGFARSVPRTNALNLESLVIPRPERTFQLRWLHDAAVSLPAVSQAGYVGVPLLLIVAALAARSWRERSTRFLVIMFSFAVLIAVGPDLAAGALHAIPVPWALAWKLPLARSAFPVRFMVFGYAALAVIVAVFLSAPTRHPALRWALGGLAVAAVVANIPFVAPSRPGVRAQLPGFITTGQYRRYLARGETVLVISARGNAGLLDQAVTDFYFKIAGGFVNQAMTPRSDLPAAIRSLRTPNRTVESAALDYLQDSGIGAVLFENSGPEPALLTAFQGMGLHRRVVGGVTLFQVPRGVS